MLLQSVLTTQQHIITGICYYNTISLLLNMYFNSQWNHLTSFPKVTLRMLQLSLYIANLDNSFKIQ